MLIAALVDGGLKLRESPFPEILNNEAFVRLRPLVSLRPSPDLDRDQPTGRGAIVEIASKGMGLVSLRVDHPKGHSLRGGPTWEDLLRKWQEGLPECDANKMISVASVLEHIEDVSELLKLLDARQRSSQ